MKKIQSNEDGQTVVEYILLMFVMITVIISAMTQVQDWFIGNADNCQPDTKTFICKMDKTFNGYFNSYASMRFFTIIR